MDSEVHKESNCNASFGQWPVFKPGIYAPPSGRGHPESARYIRNVPERDEPAAMFDGNYCWWFKHRAPADRKQRGELFASEYFRFRGHDRNMASVKNFECSILLRLG